MWDFKTEEVITVQLIGAALLAPCPVSPAKQLSQQREQGRQGGQQKALTRI